ncbi:MAG TPA: glycosyltransferase family 4 protein [Propionibacterium sp.]|nr:glycosyltransferase family 4 protein [Propionibacterium sp.]
MTDRVLVVEPNMEGHRFNYVRLLIAECQRRGLSVVLLTTPSGREDFVAKAGSTEIPEWELLPDGTWPFPRDLEVISRKVQATTVVVPDGDGIALALARRPWWRGSGELRILIMRATAQAGRHPRLQPLRTWIRRAGFAVAEVVPRVTVLTLGSALDADANRSEVSDPIEFEPTDQARQVVREAMGPDPDRFWFAIAGWLDARKNIPLVLTALDDAARSADRPLGLLLAGRQDAELTDTLRAVAPGDVRLAALSRHLTDAELDAAVELSDCMVLAHSNEGPSGILGKAAAARTKVIAAGARTLAKDVQRLGHSAQWVPLDRAALTTAALNAIHQPPAAEVAYATPRDFAIALLGLR